MMVQGASSRKLQMARSRLGAITNVGAYTYVPPAGGCNDTTKDESPGGSLGDSWFGDTIIYNAGQFQAGSTYSICEADVKIKRDGTCARTAVVEIRSDDGNGDTAKPTTTIHATSGAIDISAYGDTYTLTTFTFGTPYSLQSGTLYWLTVKLSGTCAGGNAMSVEVDGGGPQTGHYSSTNGSTWTQVTPWTTLTFETRD